MLTTQKVNFDTIQGYVNAAHELQEVGDTDGCYDVLEKLKNQLEKAINENNANRQES